VKLAKSSTKLKAKIGEPIEKPLLSFAFVPFNYFNNLDFTPIRNRILPEMDEGIVLDYESPPGTSLEETDRMLVEVEKIIRHIGSGGL
jgi:multidrug efflux pump subunit AcrB